MNSALDQIYFKNTVLDYLIALGIILVGTIILRIVKYLVLKRLTAWSESTPGKIDDVVITSLQRFGIAALQFAIIYWGISYLELSERFGNVFHVVTSIIVTYFLLRLISTIMLIILQQKIRSQERGENKIKQLGGLMLLINILIWAIGIVFLLDNLEYDVTTIITGLGIGGIAIALAAQNILGDLFNYFVIFFDRPFEAGDFITVDDKAGTVEYVGIKTTRVRALGGEQIIIGNSNLTGSRIHNFRRLFTRRIVFSINVDYRTPLEKIKLIPDIIKLIVLKHQDVTFDRSHLAALNDWSIRFETVYIVQNPDYNRYMDIQQAILLDILDALQQNEILIALPYSSQGQNNRQLQNRPD